MNIWFYCNATDWFYFNATDLKLIGEPWKRTFSWHNSHLDEKRMTLITPLVNWLMIKNEISNTLRSKNLEFARLEYIRFRSVLSYRVCSFLISNSMPWSKWWKNEVLGLLRFYLFCIRNILVLEYKS